MSTPAKLVFFGTEDFSVPSLRALISAGYNIVAIVTKPDSQKGRGKRAFVHPVKQVGLDFGIPVLQPEKLKDIDSELADLQTDAAVLVSYGKIIPQRTLDLFHPVGIVNLHPSRLPQYRGPSPIEATILAGDKSTAISLMKLDAGMDTGPVFVQAEVNLSGNETKPELSALLANRGAELLVETLPKILDGTIQPQPQTEGVVSVTTLISKSDGLLNPSTDDATTLERKVRAYQGFPKPHLKLLGYDVIITSTKVVESSDELALTITCADQTNLAITSLIAPSGREMSAEAFLNGYSKK